MPVSRGTGNKDQFSVLKLIFHPHRFDIIEQLLLRNMVEMAEAIFFYVGKRRSLIVAAHASNG